jgi:hypothetical protein
MIIYILINVWLVFEQKEGILGGGIFVFSSEKFD